MELDYQGFRAKVNYSAETGLFYGEILNCEDVIAFQCHGYGEIGGVMAYAIDTYLNIKAG